MSEVGPIDDAISMAARQYGEKFPWADVRSIEIALRLSATQSTIHASNQRLFRENGFERAAGRIAVLRVLYLSPMGRLSQHEISNQTQVTPANVSYVIEGLEKDGLVTRTPHETDRRAIWAQLTPEGKKIFSEIAPAMTAHLSSLGAGFTEEEKMLFSSFLQRMRENAEST
jgi:MarR family transcriptional regulator, 2-MHQ and catechol-resistance regulon repressor